MHIDTTRATPARSASRPTYVPSFPHPASRTFLDEEVYPGITRAQLREDIIEQIG